MRKPHRRSTGCVSFPFGLRHGQLACRLRCAVFCFLFLESFNMSKQRSFIFQSMGNRLCSAKKLGFANSFPDFPSWSFDKRNELHRHQGSNPAFQKINRHRVPFLESPEDKPKGSTLLFGREKGTFCTCSCLPLCVSVIAPHPPIPQNPCNNFHVLSRFIPPSKGEPPGLSLSSL